MKNLQAIEDDDVAALSSAFLYKSFVRQFAEQVNINYSDIHAEVVDASHSIPEPLVPGQEQVSTIKVPALPTARRRSSRWLYPVGSLAVMVVACSGFYAVWQRAQVDLPGPVIGPTHMASTPDSQPPNSGAAQNPTLPPAQTLSTPGSRTPKARPRTEPNVTDAAPEAKEPLRLEVSAVERTWLSIMADGRQSFSGILEASDTKVLEGQQTARIRTGNAGGVNVVFNGKDLGVLGPRGQVRTAVFTREGYEIVPPSAHIALMHFIPGDE